MSLIDTLTGHFKDSVVSLSASIMLSATVFFGIFTDSPAQPIPSS
jgi:hypothetical protein